MTPQATKTIRFRTYRQALDYLFHFTDYERMHRVTKATSVFGLSRMNKLLEHCGNPHLKQKAAHVAGTKGKGSTAAMLASILHRAGYRVGLYTSPHVMDVRERIQIDGEWIRKRDVVRLLRGLVPYLEVARKGGETYAPTFFETFTVLSFLHFLEQKVDIAVVEVGLGGRLDATNVLQPEVCAITPISRDHMDKLGDTIPEIAGEKAGIIKLNVPVVSGVQRPEALEVIRGRCEELAAPLRVVGDDVRLTERGASFDLATWRRTLSGLTVPLVGRHQRENAATAVAMAEILCERGLRVDDGAIRAGLESLHWPGRIQTVARNPEIIVDGAHNEASIRALVDVLDAMPRKRTIFVLAIARDKDIPPMLELLAPRGDLFVVTKTSNPRAADPAELKAILGRYCSKPVQAAESPAAAFKLARALAAPADRIVVAGSMYLVGDVLIAMRKERREA